MQTTINALKQNGFNVYSFDTTEELKAKVLELIPENSEVMTMTSVSLDTLGISDVLNNSGKYRAVRPKLYVKDPEAAYHANAPEFVIGSVHAVTEQGEMVIASASGSQLPAYAYGAKNVIFVVGSQKLVANLDAALKRIYDYVLPLEDERAQKAYGVHSSVNKLLILNKEPVDSRTTVLLLNQPLGF